jgi:hypothetical protein
MALPSISFADLAASQAPPSASQAAMNSAITPTFSNTTNTVTNASEMANLDSMASGGTGGIIPGVGNLANEALGGVGNILTNTVGAIGGGVSTALSAVTSLATGDISGFASQLSKAAGNLNDLLSMKRSSNLPSGAELFAEQRATVLVSPGTENDWRVRIDAPWEQFNSPLFSKHLENTGGVVWPYLPNITVASKANYSNPDITHSNYAIQAYKNSQVEDIQISGEFTCETETDAQYWLAATTFFKTATKMFFGQGAHAGNPPVVCWLSGYGPGVFNRVPVVIKSFSVELKDSVNYIRCNSESGGAPTWVPIISTVTVTVSPIYNRTTIRQFSLTDYAKGNLTTNGVGFL